MSPSTRMWHHSNTLGMTSVITGMLLLIPCAPASADSAQPAVMPSPSALTRLADVTRPEDHFAGSEIAKHEGRGSPRTVMTLEAGEQPGLDVSGHQQDIAWAAVAASGGKFAYVKATEGVGYQSPYFNQQYIGSANAGLVRGAYHFALPDRSSGSEQAVYFVNRGGGWSADGITLPPALDMEYNPYGDACYGYTPYGMALWVQDFSQTVARLTGRYPTIYTSTSWWNSCTGGNDSFASTNPLWIARYSTSLGALPAGWSIWTFWQWNNSGVLPGDQDSFNGGYGQLQNFASR